MLLSSVTSVFQCNVVNVKTNLINVFFRSVWYNQMIANCISFLYFIYFYLKAAEEIIADIYR